MESQTVRETQLFNHGGEDEEVEEGEEDAKKGVEDTQVMRRRQVLKMRKPSQKHLDLKFLLTDRFPCLLPTEDEEAIFSFTRGSRALRSFAD